MIESKLFDDVNRADNRVAVHNREMLEMEAAFAADMVARWGMVATIPDGEDKSGRTKVRCATPVELVYRACVTSELLFAEFKRREWIHITPSVLDKSTELQEEG